MRLRAAQERVFERYAAREFAEQMVDHLLAFNPPLCRTLKRRQLRALVDDGMQRAARYGFDRRGSARLFLELMLVFGHGFDRDVQYPWIAAALHDDSLDGLSWRADRLHHLAGEYLVEVCGKNNFLAAKALLRLRQHGKEHHRLFAAAGPEANVHRLLRDVFPSKADKLGEAGIHALVVHATHLCEQRLRGPHHGAAALLATLMFFVGSGCLDDPFYAWIDATLVRSTPVERRVERLERRARIWLDAAITNTGAVAASATPEEVDDVESDAHAG